MSPEAATTFLGPELCPPSRTQGYHFPARRTLQVPSTPSSHRPPEYPQSTKEIQSSYHLSPKSVMQIQEDGDNFLPFAKCSRVVSRSSLSSLSSQSHTQNPLLYGDVFWENLTQSSSLNWIEEQYIPPVLRGTSCSQPGLHPLGLPPPEQLWRRKRRTLHLERMQQGPGSIPAQVRAVTYHLEDLKRRQRTINEMKKAQWVSSEAVSGPQILEGGCGFPSTTEYPVLEEERVTYPQEDNHFVTPGAQLLWSPWSPLGHQGAYASGRLSSLAYSTTTVRRNPIYNPQ